MRLLVLTILILPTLAEAAVTINEVAWMGSTDSANHEWIELHNNGAAAVDVTGWTVTDTTNLSIELAGSIAADEHVVLERSSDASAPGTAFLIYTGALVNTGTTLFLRRADGGLEDQVAGGDDWKNIGGDNTTKETAQYTTSGWVTAVATPGAANATFSATPTTEETVVSSGRSKRGVPVVSASRDATALSLPENTLSLTIDGPEYAYVNQAIAFSVSSAGVGNTIANSLTYEWNFGDSYTENGSEVSHRFLYPGTYLVAVHGQYKRQSYVARQEITVLPVTLSVTRNDNGDVQISNDAPYEIDLSGFTIAGSREVTLPQNTYILPNQTITLAGHRVGSLVGVHDDTGTIVLSEGYTAPQTIVVAANNRVTTGAEEVAVARTVTLPSPGEPELTAIATATPEVITIGVTEESPTVPTNPRWPYGVATIIFGAIALAVLIRANRV